MFVYQSKNEKGEKNAIIVSRENDSFITVSQDDPSELPKRAYLFAKAMELARNIETEKEYNEKKDIFDKLNAEILEEIKNEHGEEGTV